MQNTAIKLMLGLGLITGATMVSSERVEAAIVNVESQYRIISVDRAEKRIGVALADAPAGERQAWVYIKPETRSSMRKSIGNGMFRDQSMNTKSVLDAAEGRIGGLMKIKGGRDFDGSIDAKKIWM